MSERVAIATDFVISGDTLKLVEPYPERFMEAYPVSRRVNSPANNEPDLTMPM